MKTLLITGATGFIGSYLLDALVQKPEYKIVILKRSTSDIFRIEKNLHNIIAYDLDKIALKTVFEKHEIHGVIHLATYYVKSHSEKDIENMIDSNVKFPSVLLEYCNSFNVDFFINTGTFFEYSTFENPINEKSENSPFNLYSSTKSSFDSILKFYAKSSKLNMLTLKLGAPFGYNDNLKLIPFLIDSVLNNKTITLEKGEQEWDFIYVKDVVSAYMKAIELCLNTKRSLFEEILIGTGKTTSIKKIVSIVGEVSQTNLISLKKDYPSNQIFLSSIDNSKAKNLLQWVPQYTIEEALNETYKLYKENS